MSTARTAILKAVLFFLYLQLRKLGTANPKSILLPEIKKT